MLQCKLVRDEFVFKIDKTLLNEELSDSCRSENGREHIISFRNYKRGNSFWSITFLLSIKVQIEPRFSLDLDISYKSKHNFDPYLLEFGSRMGVRPS